MSKFVWGGGMAAAIIIVSPVSIGAQQRTYTFDIAAQPLDGALRHFARATRQQVLFDGSLVRGRQSVAVTGAHTPVDALATMLQGSGLVANQGSLGVFVIKPAPVAITATPAAPLDAAVDAVDIVVTANKRSERIIDVANSVTALPEDDLLKRNLTRIEEFAAQVPGLSIETGINGGVRLVLRGENTGGSGATVAATVDDAPLSYTAANGGGASDTANIDTFDLERIEVLRGPQGTLYGSAAEGGLIKYVINKPNYDALSAKAEGGVEGVSNGGLGFSTRGVINVPLIEGKLALRASGFYFDTPGYIQNPLRGASDVNRGQRYGGRIALAWRATDTLSFRLTGLRQQQDFDGYGVVETLGSHASPATPPANFLDIANGGILERNSLISEYNRRQFNLYDGTINWALPFIDVTSVTSYGEILTTYAVDNSNFALGGPNTVASLFGPRYGQAIVASSDIAFTLHKFNQEVRLSTKPGTEIFKLPVEIQGGFFYTKENIYVNSITDIRSAANPAIILTSPLPGGGTLLPATYEEYAGFGEANVHLTTRLTVTGGARYSANNQTSQTTTLAGLLTGPLVVRPTNYSSESKVTWNGAARYALGDRANVYVRVASGYRPGGPLTPVPGAPADFPTQYHSDQTVNYEAGFKGDLFGRRLSLDVTGFYIDWNNIQINSFFTSAISGLRYATTGNAGTAVSRGVEYSVGLTPFKGFKLGAIGAYTDAHLTQSAPAFGGLSNDKLPYVPEFSNTLNFDYTTRLGDRLKGFVGGSWQYVGARYSDFGTSLAFSNHVRLPGYDAVNVQAGVETGHLRFEVFARNVNDSRGITRYQGGNGYRFTDTVDIIPPRTVGARVTGSF